MRSAVAKSSCLKQLCLDSPWILLGGGGLRQNASRIDLVFPRLTFRRVSFYQTFGSFFAVPRLFTEILESFPYFIIQG